MINLLIVDDEKFSREQILYEIGQSDLHFDSIMQATDGIDALEKAKSFKPTILLTDIKMRRMSGIELAQQFAEKYPGCKLIFMSAYSDKEYLKSAITLNAVDYIEKPIVTSELYSTLKKAIDKLNNYTDYSINQMYKTVDLLISKQFAEEADKEIKQQGLSEIYDSNIAVCILKASEDGKINEFSTQFLNSLGKLSLPAIYTLKNHKLSIFLIYSKTLTADNFETIIKQAFTVCLNNLNTDESLKCAAGTLENSYKNAYISYQNAVCALDTLFFYDSGAILFYSASTASDEPDFSQYIEKLTAAFKSGDYDASLFVINEIYNRLKNNNMTLSSVAKKIYCQITEEIYNFSKKNYMYAINEMNMSDAAFSIFNMTSLNQLHNYIIRAFNTMYNSINSDNSAPLIRRSIEFIEKNYTNAFLSITDIADACETNSTYLCNIFKRSTDKTITNYINELRVDHAKRLLTETTDSVLTISKKCGFNDSKYFCTVFRKYTETTPTVFRKKYSKHGLSGN